MAPRTKAQKIERENQEQALSFFRETLAALPDARRRQGQRYPLQTVVVTALMAMVCGCDDAEAMQSWGEANADWLESILDMPHGPPTQDVFLSVFAALDPEAFSAGSGGRAPSHKLPPLNYPPRKGYGGCEAVPAEGGTAAKRSPQKPGRGPAGDPRRPTSSSTDSNGGELDTPGSRREQAEQAEGALGTTPARR